MITQASVDAHSMRAAVIGLLRQHQARPSRWDWLTERRWWRRLFGWASRSLRLTSYDCVLHWQGGRFVECDVRATVKGFERPARHCREAYVMGKRDPDQIARTRIAEGIILICEPLWRAYDNVRVRAYLSRGVPSCMFEEPGVGALI